MIENLKKLISEMDSKSEFIDFLSNHFSMSAIYLQRNWFQAEWRVPEEKMEEVITIAQNWLFQQNQRKNKVLKETGFDFNSVVVKDAEIVK